MSDELDLDALLAVADAATPGPWRYRLFNGADQIMAPDADEEGGEWPVVGMGGSYDPQEVPTDPHFMFDQDAEFIATFDPTTVRALIEKVRSLEAVDAVSR